MTQHRSVAFEGVSNFRDLGGYLANDGRVTRWGWLYRSDALHGLTKGDLERFRALRIATVVDLRSSTEVEYTGRGRLSSEPIRFVNTAVAHEQIGQGHHLAASDDGDLLHRYLRYVERGEVFVQAIKEMLDTSNYPMVVNCFFGKDRTGVLIALVLSCIGIDRATIIDDYRLSDARMPFIIERLRSDPVYRETIDRTSPSLLVADASTMSAFLTELDERFGGARVWATRAGVTQRQLEALGELLLE